MKKKTEISKTKLFFIGLIFWITEHKRRIAAWFPMTASVLAYVIALYSIDLLFSKYFWVFLGSIAAGALLTYAAFMIDPTLTDFDDEEKDDEEEPAPVNNITIVQYHLHAKDYSEDFEIAMHIIDKYKNQELNERVDRLIEAIRAEKEVTK